MTSGRDPGLQWERTVLAWRRTGLTAAVLAAFFIRDWLTRPTMLGAAATLSVVGVTALSAIAAYRTRAGVSPQRRLLVVMGGIVLTGLLTIGRLLA